VLQYKDREMEKALRREFISGETSPGLLLLLAKKKNVQNFLLRYLNNFAICLSGWNGGIAVL